MNNLYPHEVSKHISIMLAHITAEVFFSILRILYEDPDNNQEDHRPVSFMKIKHTNHTRERPSAIFCAITLYTSKQIGVPRSLSRVSTIE